MKSRRSCFTLIVLISLLLAALPHGQGQAAAIIVTSRFDGLDAAGTCAAVTPASLPGPDGYTSLREAICAANNNPGADTIAFNITGCPAARCSILLTSQLPYITDDQTTINGYSQPGASPATPTAHATILIELDGTSAGNSSGLWITSDENVITGLAIKGFNLLGIAIGPSPGGTETPANNIISGNYIGVNWNGTVCEGNGLGIHIGGGAHDNLIGGDEPAERNVVSCSNELEGIGIHGVNTFGNVVSGNYIGTNKTGSADLGNNTDGVRIYGGAHDNIVGGDSPGERNIIAGNDRDGVLLVGAGTNGNTVTGNYIGLNVNGVYAIMNQNKGVRIENGACYNRIGGTGAGERNVIGGSESGVYIQDTTTRFNTVMGNFIGTNAAGTGSVDNATGVYLYNSVDNTIGGENPGEGNLISGNFASGITIAGPFSSGNFVAGNLVGTDSTGLLSLGNGAGITLNGMAHGNTVGPGNIVSGNNDNGIILTGSAYENTLIGNFIGTNILGTGAVANGGVGILITNGAHDNSIGGDSPVERNLISGNGQVGLLINGDGPGTSNNRITGNFIGLDKSGAAVLGNFFHGVEIRTGASANYIGGPYPGEGNVISGNGNNGVLITGDGTNVNGLINNLIGTDFTGAHPLGNYMGVDINSGAQGNAILGGVIAYNGAGGVTISGDTTTGNIISAASIHDNGFGIELSSEANGSILPPGIMSVTLEGGMAVISGKGDPARLVEIFSSPTDDGQGEYYLGSTTVDALGFFEYSAGWIPYPYLTATQRDSRGTSEFSPAVLSTVRWTFLPVVLKLP